MSAEKPSYTNEVTGVPPEEQKEGPVAIDVKGILDLGQETHKLLQQSIEARLRQELAGHTIPNDKLDNFAARLKERYIHDEKALAIIDEGLATLLKPENIQSCNKYHINVLKNAFIGFKTEQQASTLYWIASFLKGRPLEQSETIADVLKSLRGKRVLVLGDDTGSLSELLRHYGAESYGIEKDRFKLLIARSGILSLNGQPQEQTFEGSIGDFFENETTPLLKRLKELGPFDMIVSDYVFNNGSGIEEEPIVKTLNQASRKLSGPLKEIKSDFLENPVPSPWDAWDASSTRAKAEAAETYNKMTKKFRENCDNLLNDNGLQLHLRVDERHIFDMRHVDALTEPSMIVVPKNEQLRKRPKKISTGISG